MLTAELPGDRRPDIEREICAKLRHIVGGYHFYRRVARKHHQILNDSVVVKNRVFRILEGTKAGEARVVTSLVVLLCFAAIPYRQL